MKVFDKVINYFSLKKAAIPVHSRSVRYETLTPNTVDEEKLSEYFNAINYAMHQKDVRNIAVTGPYGAGKALLFTLISGTAMLSTSMSPLQDLICQVGKTLLCHPHQKLN